jgi:hypothetical protein
LRTDALRFVAQLVLMAAGEAAVVEAPEPSSLLVREQAARALERVGTL